MNRKTLRTRGSALALAAVLAVTLALPASAAEAISDGVSPTYDEAYYATLDYYGNLLEGSVVKSYSLNGKDSLTDYGVYDEVVNLTDGTAPVGGEGSTSFRFSGGAPDHFYFEGKTKQPFADLPWTITLRYTLNGVPAKAEDLAGKQGVVEILLDVVPNEGAGDYARYNYTLAATALFNQDDILSLEAEGAQVQLVGNLRTVLFLCLPGEEQHFTIRVGSNSFTFGGLTVMMMPATLAQLAEISKLSQRKDDLEEDYRALSGSLDELLDALSDIQDGLYASAKGLDQLDAARGTFSSGKGKLYDGAGVLRGDLTNLAELLDPVEERVSLLSRTVTDSKTVLNELVDTTVVLQEQLSEIEAALYGLEQGTCDLQHVIDVAGDMEGSLLRLEHALGGSHVNTHSVATNSKATVEKVKNVHGAYSADTQAEFLQKLLEAQGMGSAQAQAEVASQLASLQKLQQAMAHGYQPNEKEQAALKQAQDMQNLYAAAKGGMSFQDFCGHVVSSPEDAKMMNDLWLIYNAGGSTPRVRSNIQITLPSGQEPQTPEAPAVPAPEVPAPETPVTPETPAPETPDSETPAPETPETPAPEAPETPDSEAPGIPVPEIPEIPAPEIPEIPALEAPEVPEVPSAEAAEAPEEEPLSAQLVFNDSLEDDSSEDDENASENSEDNTPDPPSEDSGEGSGENVTESSEETPPAPPSENSGETGTETPGGTPAVPSGPSENDTVGGAVVDLITSGLDSASARIDQIQYQLTSAINSIKYPTSAVVGDLADLCGELGVLTGSLNDAGYLMGSLGESAGTLRDILADVDALRTVLNGYEPTLQEALANAGTLSTSAAATIRDTETLLSDAENLAKSTGADLDAGTKQSLRGLSAALRQTAKALAATGRVKEAKNTITDIIEDTWNEYTGDVNNILLMDAEAEPVSLTDQRNPAPTSIQVLIRTQEIKEADQAEDDENAAVKAESTFWGRVTQMFRDFWNAVTGIFQ